MLNVKVTDNICKWIKNILFFYTKYELYDIKFKERN